MKTNSNRTSITLGLIAVITLALGLSACGLHIGTIDQVVTVSLSEDMLNVGHPTFSVSGHRSPDTHHPLREAFDCVEVDGLRYDIHNCLEEVNTSHSHNFWEEFEGVQIDRMELKDGFIRLLGTCATEDSLLQSCSFDVSMYAQDGMLVTEIIAVDIPGVTMSDPRILQINQDMLVEFSMDQVDTTGGVSFQEVTITEEALEMTLRVTLTF